ncbi:MAG TPA: hypothetical protein VHC95_01260 [Opitutales bacterium]|nr:hypothetical protein [Opitutales bacterium]
MRKRPSPEGARFSRRGLRAAGAFLLVAGLAAATSAILRAQAEKGVIGDRVDRVHTAQAAAQTEQVADTTAWTPPKIILNLDARCPVVTALGYFGAFATSDPDPAKAAELQSRYAQLQKTAQPIADELKKIATANAFAGRKFPAALNPRLNVLSAELYGEILKLYGDEAAAEFRRYVATQTQGAYVPD